METHILFGGSAVAAVTAAGSIRLPRFVRDALCGRAAGEVIVGAHQTDPCLVSYPPAHLQTLLQDLERRRIEEESTNPEVHYPRARRVFGFAERISVSRDGRLVLPPALRRRSGIAGAALFVGIGRKVEIWSLDRASQSGDPGLRELAMAHGPEGKAQ
ncbi:MAG: division/cell wall cluster transcriptional repressor MraZ [Allosphingosinicella sp.]